MVEPFIENNVKAERLAAGIGTVAELAELAGIDPTWCAYIEDGRVLPTANEYQRLLVALGDIPANRLYTRTWRQLTKVDSMSKVGQGQGISGIARYWNSWRDESHMLMARDEINYYDRSPGLDHRVDVYVNLSCGTQRSPHLLMDTVSVMEALGVSFVAAAGPSAGCCGKPIALEGRDGAYERIRESRLQRSETWGATTHVNWCGACVQIGTDQVARHELTHGVVSPIRETQVIPFLEEWVRSMGDKVPWKKTVHRRVLAEGHRGQSQIHGEVQKSIARLLAMVPGVEVVDLFDGWWSSNLSPCVAFGREGSPPPEWATRPQTPEEIAEHRVRLAEDIRARGADTVSGMHQTCHQMWSRYASDQLAVIHPVSILAEALDCVHPDRFQTAARHGDPQRLVEESRPQWQSWGMTEERAAELAESLLDHDQSTRRVVLDDELPVTSCLGGCGGCQAHSVPAHRPVPSRAS
jgi:cysteine-rich protein